MSDLRPIVIDGVTVEVDPNLTLIQACEVAGVEIPRFCYHERLSIAGNCRMCLVEVVGGPPKPAASCAMQVRDMRPGRNGEPPEIRTNSPMVKKAREGVMEFLLINHPLDCPICDQGGECDLQDQAMAYGVDFSRYREPKRAAEDLQLGPLVGTHMTRCISCTRCVRFITEVAGVAEMGQTGRGEDSEITSYLGAILTSEMQGNVVDLCPVGALTNKPYAFTARPWELRKVESVDVMDALGSNIRLDVRGREVMRILPRNHDDVNEEWIADRTRHVVDGLRRQRLDRPYVRENGRLRPASWAEAFAACVGAMQGAKVAALAGDLVPVEPLFALKQLVEGLGGRVECRTDGAALPEGDRAGYAGTAKIADIDTAARIVIVGSDPRAEAPVLNARLRKAWLNGAQVGLIGEAVDLTFPVEHLGTGGAALSRVEPGALVVLGMAALSRPDGAAVLAAARAIGPLLALHTAAARVGAMDVGFATAGGLAAALDGAKVVYNYGVDEVDVPAGPFVIYHGAHGDRGAHRADVVLPGAAYTEQSGIYVNLEGRPQMAFRAGFPPGEAREDWAVIRALSERLGAKLPYDSLDALRRAVVTAHPHLGRLDTVEKDAAAPAPAGGALDDAPFDLAVRAHYLTNPVARASAVMGELARLAAERTRRPMAAE